MTEDYYSILGVDKRADKEEIKKAYKKLAMELHPDRNKGDRQTEERFKKVNEAYAVLSDDEKRKQYNRMGAEGFSKRFSTDDIFKNFDVVGILKELGISGGLIESIFGGRGKSRPKPGFNFDFMNDFVEKSGFNDDNFTTNEAGDSEMEITLTLEEAAFGVKKKVIQVWGKARYPLYVIVPPGIENGNKLRLKGKGEVDISHGVRGDLYCRVKILPHNLYTRQENNLVTEKEIALTTLILGGFTNIVTLDKKNLQIEIPPQSANNTLIKVKGKGVPKDTGSAGDLLVRLKVKMPKKLDDAQKEIFEDLRDSGL